MPGPKKEEMGRISTAPETELKRKPLELSPGPHSTRAGADGLMMGARLRRPIAVLPPSDPTETTRCK